MSPTDYWFEFLKLVFQITAGALAIAVFKVGDDDHTTGIILLSIFIGITVALMLEVVIKNWRNNRGGL